MKGKSMQTAHRTESATNWSPHHGLVPAWRRIEKRASSCRSPIAIHICHDALFTVQESASQLSYSLKRGQLPAGNGPLQGTCEVFHFQSSLILYISLLWTAKLPFSVRIASGPEYRRPFCLLSQSIWKCSALASLFSIDSELYVCLRHGYKAVCWVFGQHTYSMESRSAL